MQKKAVLITGAAKRIGRVLVERCVQAGYDIVLHYHKSENEAAELQQYITSLGRTAYLVQQDLADLAELSVMVKRAKQHMPHLCAMVNNASIFKRIGLLDLDAASLSYDMAVNLHAPILLSQAFATYVESGAIVNIIDTATTGYNPNYFGYLLTKKSLYEFTKMAARELAPKIQVNAVAPGFILPSADNSHDPCNSNLHNICGNKPEAVDVADAVLYLLQQKYLYGQILYVDGGQSLL